MQIAGASRYPVPASTALPAHPLSPGPSAEPARANPSPALPGQTLGDGQSSDARERADRPAGSAQSTEPSPQQRSEQLQIAELASRDRQVRAHEQAHAAAGGPYAGAPSYSYSRGPDGKRYAVAGEVGIDVAAVPNDPQATLAKMEVVLRAALAPAEPSAQDLRVAAQAQAQMLQARAELAESLRGAGQPTPGPRPAAADLELYLQLGDSPPAPARVDLFA